MKGRCPQCRSEDVRVSTIALQCMTCRKEWARTYRYAVDGAGGWTTQFVSTTAAVMMTARRKVEELFPIGMGPYEVWELEADSHVGSFGEWRS